MRFFTLILAIAQCVQGLSISCDYITTIETRTIAITPGIAVDIPDLPYHLKCTHGDRVLINTNKITRGRRAVLSMDELSQDTQSTPFHLTYTHSSPLLIKLAFSQPLPPLHLETREEKQLEEEQGFLRQYWMYIVPFLVIMLLTSGGEEEPAAAGAAVVVRQ